MISGVFRANTVCQSSRRLDKGLSAGSTGHFSTRSNDPCTRKDKTVESLSPFSRACDHLSPAAFSNQQERSVRLPAVLALGATDTRPNLLL